MGSVNFKANCTKKKLCCTAAVFVIKVNICGWIEHLISRPIARKRSFVALLFISIFEFRFLQEEYARRVSMKYFKNIPDRVWSVCEANSLNIEMS